MPLEPKSRRATPTFAAAAPAEHSAGKRRRAHGFLRRGPACSVHVTMLCLHKDYSCPTFSGFAGAVQGVELVGDGMTTPEAPIR